MTCTFPFQYDHVTEPESFKLEKTLKIINSNHHLTLPSPPVNQIPRCHVHVSLEYLQGWGIHRCPWQTLSEYDHPLFEEIHPDIQFKPPLV